MASSGTVLFARYAYPPNELGYCGPDDPHALLEAGGAGLDDDAIAERARQFDGAWVYLELIAAAAGIADPLDARVVQAYWLGNDLLDELAPDAFLAGLDRRFRGQVGGWWRRLSGSERAGARPHHSFQVFAVYPWVGLLPAGSAEGGVALSVLDRCRIRWGHVERLDGERAIVRSQPLTWDGHRLALGPERLESGRWAEGGQCLAPAPVPGRWVALHWDWICDQLDPDELAALRATSTSQLELANRHLAGVPA